MGKRFFCVSVADAATAGSGGLTYWRTRRMSRHMSERTTVRLPEELIARAKRKAAAEGRTLTSLIEDGLRRVVASKPARKGERILPPVSTATGGLKPGIDISNSAALQEMDDLEYIERLKRGFR
ncbi:MAG: DUF6364 family protein [Bauldia sp.]